MNTGDGKDGSFGIRQFGVEIYSRPANRTVADFMGHINLLPGRVVGLSGADPVIEATAGWRGTVPGA